MRLTDHVITVPIDHDRADGPTVEVYAREIADADGLDRPYLVYLQGGPGHEAPRPSSLPMSPSWLGRALRDYRVIMLDQRGTGRSTPYGSPGQDPAADADHLRHFRADAIVRDAECLREHLGARTWSLLGQSFGGFCALHYLSVSPDSLREVFFTGGLPPVGLAADGVYSATFDMARVLNRRFHRRFPQDAARLAELLDRCDADEVRSPYGEPITRRLMRTVGAVLGTNGGAEKLHHLLELDFASPAFSHDAVTMMPFGARNPLYAVVHESSYADGGATRWTAERVEPEDFRGESLLLTAEHLFSWHFEDVAGLRPYRAVAATIAEYD